MTLTCYSCPRRLAWKGTHLLRDKIAKAFGWLRRGDRFYCETCCDASSNTQRHTASCQH